MNRQTSEIEHTGPITIRFEKVQGVPAPFERSLHLILQTAIRDQYASGACLYELEGSNTLSARDTLRTDSDGEDQRLETASLELSKASSAWLLQLAEPVLIPEAATDARIIDFPEMLLYRYAALAVVPLRKRNALHGILTIGWENANSLNTPPHMVRLAALGNSAAALLTRSSESKSAAHLASKLVRLESDLADWKISERAAGVLSSDLWTDDVVMTLHDHVQRVLQSPDNSLLALERQVAELESALKDRKLLGQAKTVLQNSYTMTEEEAYLHLRNTSRRTRRALRDIADDILRTQGLDARRSA
ncbi:MAG: ANTAR domain-containing protein [Bryobacteraceae bacterium]|nr:ANTAR domain-containing protein [Bryobacteraceae bacterium]